MNAPRSACPALLLTALAVLVAAAGCGTTERELTPTATESSEVGERQPQPDQEQGQSAEPMTLPLSGPSRCQTTRGQSYGVDAAVYDDEGNYVRTERRFVGHYEVKRFRVSWSVSGGTAPYSLTIDGASEDESGPFEGRSGVGGVYCTDTTIGSFIDDAGDRALRDDPMIDSGLKSVRAAVTDADGRTAESEIRVYVIFATGDGGTPLSAGETYRIHGHLVTIPDRIAARVGGYEEVACEGVDCENRFGINLEGDDFIAAMYFGVSSGREFRDSRYIQLKDRGRRGSEAESRRQEIDGLLDALSDSVGKLPHFASGDS